MKALSYSLSGVVVVLLLFGMYVAGYFLLGARQDYDAGLERRYPTRWLAQAFWPAGKVEERLRGIDVELVWGDVWPNFRDMD